ncbi:MAG: phosphate ABC transporter substrate-binding protein [Spirochaetales bacterium]|nr:phosphate ABC transporter substrate-binding protein [Spirochaetales bacterium]
MKKIVTIMVALAVLTAGFAFASGQQEAEVMKLSMGGSTTCEPIIRSAIEAYADVDPNAELSYEGTGSSVGVQSALDGVYDLGGASRDLKSKESSAGAVATPIALDGIAVVANNSVGIDNISLEDLAKIYSGEIKNWSEVGGADVAIVVINRDEASGTRAAFGELVVEKALGKGTEYLKEAITVESNGDMVTKVGSTPDSIGFCGLGYVDKAISGGAKALLVEGAEPTVDNILTGAYKISRKLNIVSKGEPAGNAKVFIDYLLSDAGQSIVEDEGFIALP